MKYNNDLTYDFLSGSRRAQEQRRIVYAVTSIVVHTHHPDILMPMIFISHKIYSGKTADTDSRLPVA